ncbi:MAG: hypothetical protein ED557_13800 [Balneola sp.]|nr:MAG: hypothetical protein ED557_13800 [Balneola sp.]
MKSLLTVFLLLCLSTFSYGQLGLTAFPFTIHNSNVRSLSLGNATVSLQGIDGDYHVNPAGIGVSNIVQVKGMYERFGRGEHSIGLMGISYEVGRSSFGLSFRKLTQGGQILLEDRLRRIGRLAGEEHYISGVYNYRLSQGLRLGVGMNYMNANGSFSQAIATRLDKVEGFSFDIGAVYENSFKLNNRHILRTSFGFSLTDFGAGLEYHTNRSTDPLPTILKIGTGLAYESNREWKGFNLFDVSLMTNVSKLLSRKELRISGSDTSFVALPPFRQLIESWEAYEFFNGQQNVSVGLKDQLWYHVGIEVTFLSALSLRFGFENAAEIEEDFSYRSFGLGIDLYYINFDYAYLHVIEEGAFNRGYYRHGNHWSIRGRIPLNGKSERTLLELIF